MSATTKFAIAWIVIGLMIAGLLASRNVPRLIRLTSHGGHTVGQIVEMNCKNHDSAAFEFTVDGARYSNRNLIQNCETLKPGDRVDIYYDIRDPRLNSVLEPRAHLKNEIISIVLGCVIFPPLIIFGFAIWIKRKRNVNAKSLDSRNG